MSADYADDTETLVWQPMCRRGRDLPVHLLHIEQTARKVCDEAAVRDSLLVVVFHFDAAAAAERCDESR